MTENNKVVGHVRALLQADTAFEQACHQYAYDKLVLRYGRDKVLKDHYDTFTSDPEYRAYHAEYSNAILGRVVFNMLDFSTQDEIESIPLDEGFADEANYNN